LINEALLSAKGQMAISGTGIPMACRAGSFSKAFDIGAYYNILLTELSSRSIANRTSRYTHLIGQRNGLENPLSRDKTSGLKILANAA
jgi:hypothetical protein